jgi:hypothetical protein
MTALLEILSGLVWLAALIVSILVLLQLLKILKGKERRLVQIGASIVALYVLISIFPGGATLNWLLLWELTGGFGFLILLLGMRLFLREILATSNRTNHNQSGDDNSE